MRYFGNLVLRYLYTRVAVLKMEFCSTGNLNTSSTIVENLPLFAKIVATLFWTNCSFVTLDLDRLLNREL